MFVWSSAERFTCLTFLFELSEYIDGKIDFLWAYNIQMHDSILTMSKANYNYGCLNALSSFLTCYVHNFNMFWVHIYYWDICIELSSCQFCVYNVSRKVVSKHRAKVRLRCWDFRNIRVWYGRNIFMKNSIILTLSKSN